MSTIINIQSCHDLATIHQRLQEALTEAKRRRKYSRASNFTPVEQVLLTNIIAAEQDLRSILGILTTESARMPGAEQSAPDWMTK